MWKCMMLVLSAWNIIHWFWPLTIHLDEHIKKIIDESKPKSVSGLKEASEKGPLKIVVTSSVLANEIEDLIVSLGVYFIWLNCMSREWIRIVCSIKYPCHCHSRWLIDFGKDLVWKCHIENNLNIYLHWLFCSFVYAHAQLYMSSIITLNLKLLSECMTLFRDGWHEWQADSVISCAKQEDTVKLC